MRTLLVAIPAILITTGCPGPDMDEYCGEPDITDASWEDGSEATAAELRDGLLGLWEGTATFDGVEEAMTLVVNEPIEDPYLITYPHAGEGYTNMQVSDACLDTLRVYLPAQLILPESGVDEQILLELEETGFSAGWIASQQIVLTDCPADPCTLELDFDRYNASSDEQSGKLRWLDTSVVDDEAQPISEANFTITRVGE